MDRVYAAQYCYMTEESSYATLSLHKTKQGARDVIAKEVREERENHNKLYDYDVDAMPFRFGRFQAWDVHEYKVLK